MSVSNKLEGRKVFLSYAYADSYKVNHLKNILKAEGLAVIDDDEIEQGKSWQEAIQYRLNSSDFILLCHSKNSAQSDFVQYEYDQSFLTFAKNRHINIVPVRLDESPLPQSFNNFQPLDLEPFPNTDYSFLINKMVNLENISFSKLSAVAFEELILELLQRLNFKNISWNRKVDDRGFDFNAQYHSTDPFGLVEKQSWVFECKLYHQTRFDVKTVRTIVDRHDYLQRNNVKLALVTNSQFSSIVREYVDETRRSNYIDIKLIDGFMLKEIISRYEDLIQHYFNR